MRHTFRCVLMRVVIFIYSDHFFISPLQHWCSTCRTKQERFRETRNQQELQLCSRLWCRERFIRCTDHKKTRFSNLSNPRHRYELLHHNYVRMTSPPPLGATGTVGRLLVEALSKKEFVHVRAAVRDVKSHSLPSYPNVLPVEFDYTKPDTMVAALKGVWL